jgi:hypothetical protein
MKIQFFEILDETKSMSENEEEDEIKNKIKWNLYDKMVHKTSKNKKTVTCLVASGNIGSPKVFCKYKIKEKDVKITLKLNFKSLFAFGLAPKDQIKNKNFKWETEKLVIEWYCHGNFYVNGKTESYDKLTNGDIIEIKLQPSKKKITFKKKGSNNKKEFKKFNGFPVYLSCTLWYVGDSVDILKVKELDDD